MTLFVEIVYVFITVVMILVVLLQAGRGGGLGTALGGGASQGVFGGGGGADFLAKLTQGLAAGFMICAVYLAYASAHTGSSRLQAESDETQIELFDEDESVDYERIGEGTPLPLREPGAAAAVPRPVVPEAKAAAADELSEAVEEFKEQSGEPGADADAAIEALEKAAEEAGRKAAMEPSASDGRTTPASKPAEAEAPTMEPAPVQLEPEPTK